MVFYAQGGSRGVQGRKGAVQGSQIDPLDGPIAGLVEGDTFFRTPLFGYRADWEPATTSGKCMAGVPGVFWRCRAALQGPCTYNSTWVPGKTHTSKKWLIFPVCMWKWGGSAPSGQARVLRPNWPQCAKKSCCLAVPLIKG